MIVLEKQISVDPISLAEPWKKHLVVRQNSVALGNLERLRENHLRRSKSCGEGRACQPSVDFDMWSHSPVSPPPPEKKEDDEKLFKCGACLFLPGLGKAKTVKERKEVVVVSQRVSLEKFECGSWRSSTTATSNLFFDLPVELIRCSSVNDAESPVTAGFVFDNHHRKGVLKSSSSSSRSRRMKSQELLPRHVRFSTSSPTSPSSLHKARNDLNAFLEAQSA